MWNIKEIWFDLNMTFTTYIDSSFHTYGCTFVLQPRWEHKLYAQFSNYTLLAFAMVETELTVWHKLSL